MTERIARTILEFCRQRAPDRSLCPSEIARSVADDEAEWRALMPEVRRIAAALARAGMIEVVQRGRVVDIETARGPVRLRLSRQDRERAEPRAVRQRSEQ